MVVDGGRLVGIISDRDLKGATGEGPLGDIMTRAVITVAPAAAVEDAARLMVRAKISALPVVRENGPIGIVTETDVLRLFVRALGATEPSSRLDVQLSSDRSALADVVRIVESTGTRISSIMTLESPDDGREVVIRVPTINPTFAVHALAANGYTLTTPWRG